MAIQRRMHGMQMLQRKQRRLKLHKRQDFIAQNFCNGCNNQRLENANGFCTGCPFYDELRGIGQSLIELSGRADMVDWDNPKEAKKRKLIADYKELRQDDDLTEKAIAEILGIATSTLVVAKRKYGLKEVP